MQKHLYNATVGKIPWFIERFGAREILLKPLRVVFAPLIIPGLPKKTFQFRGASLPYFYHKYNMTWASERCVEVPIGKWYLDSNQGKQVLEIGNVLSHYFPVTHQILDKFEKGAGIINQDIVDFAPANKFDLLLSISTFEHIGFDDEASEPSDKKIRSALAACRKLLKPGGKLVITVPLGYNPQLNEMIAGGHLESAGEIYMIRTDRLQWEEGTKEAALKAKYKKPYPYANAILVAEFSPWSNQV